jgi:hypothetical protein
MWERMMTETVTAVTEMLGPFALLFAGCIIVYGLMSRSAEKYDAKQAAELVVKGDEWKDAVKQLDEERRL